MNPIRVSPKSSKMNASLKRKCQNNVSPIFDDCGHTIPQENWGSMLPEVKAGRLLRKRNHNSPNLQEIDPDFGGVYNENKHGEILCAELTIAHLTTFQQSVLTAVVNKYWRVFRKRGFTTSVKDY